jgi:Glycosyl transferase family 2
MDPQDLKPEPQIARWGLVTTVRAPEAKVMRFAQHHLGLGASHLWLYFDDPDDPAILAAQGLPRTTVTRCSDDHWASLAKRRPERHQNRQSRNAQHAYATCPLDWLGHIDVDEFLWPTRRIDTLLQEVSTDQPMFRIEPFEAMHDPDRPQAYAREYRGTLPGHDSALSRSILGDHAAIIPQGMLSHRVGKAFFRTGIKGLSPRLHGAFLHGERLPGPPFAKDIVLLHDHAGTYDEWHAALPFRLNRGAYQYQPDLQRFLAAASHKDLALFFRETRTLTPEKRRLLRDHGRLVVADIGQNRTANPDDGMEGGDITSPPPPT